jgi:hypothetical protein
MHYLWMIEWDVSGTKVVIASQDDEPPISDNTHHRLLPQPPHPRPNMPYKDMMPGCRPINWEAAGFHDIIGKKFYLPKAGYPANVIHYDRFDIYEGFMDREVIRIMRAQRGPILHAIPYYCYGWDAPREPLCKAGVNCTSLSTCPRKYRNNMSSNSGGDQSTRARGAPQSNPASSGAAAGSTSAFKGGQQKAPSWPSTPGDSRATAPKGGPSKPAGAHDGTARRPASSGRPESRGGGNQNGAAGPKTSGTSTGGPRPPAAPAKTTSMSVPSTVSTQALRPPLAPGPAASASTAPKAAGGSGSTPKAGGKKPIAQRIRVFSSGDRR